MTEQQDGFGRAWLGFGAEAGFEHVAESALAVQLDAAAERPGVGGGKGDAGIDCGFLVGRRFDANEILDEIEEDGLFSPGAGQ
jgi:hypothetical protein